MVRKFTILFLLCIGFHSLAKAQTLDSVTIYLPYGADTTCPGEQLTFKALQSNDTFSSTTYQWYTDGVATGVMVDTFYTTALSDGDSVYCIISYANSAGTQTAKSNTIIIHRSSGFPPHVLVSLTTGSNPGCPGDTLTFTAYPANGGTAPTYQWMVNNSPITGATNTTYTDTFGTADTVSCRMISTSPCTFPTDTGYSNAVPIIHNLMTATLSIVVANNPICAGTLDSFTATITNAGVGSSLEWFINSIPVATALGDIYRTDTLHNDDHVYAVLTAPDRCVANDTTAATEIVMSVIANQHTSVGLALTHGANPGCIDSILTYTLIDTNGGTTPAVTWYVDGTPAAFNVNTFSRAYANGDILVVSVHPTDGGCYSADTAFGPEILMIRDTTPVAPFISLIGNLLVANTAGTYIWYLNGAIIAGANTQTYHPTHLGEYFAIRDTANCQSLASDTIYISLLDVNKFEESSVKLFPNPTTGMLNIDFANQPAATAMDVYNIIGQGLRHEDITSMAHFQTDLSYLPEGSYLLVLRYGDGSSKTYKIQLVR